MPGSLIVLAILIVIVVAVVAHEMEKKRRVAFRAYAAKNRLDYTHEKDRGFDRYFRDLPFVGPGSNRYLHHQMRGEMEGHRLQIGEYHYQVTRSTGKSSSTRHYYSTLVMLQPAYRLKDLSIRKEGLFDKVKAAFGWDDINFASAEFSRTFHVTAPDRNWAYAFVQPRTMEILLRTDGVEVHIRRGWLVIRTAKGMRVEELPGLVRTGLALMAQVPDFVKMEPK